MLTLHLMRDLIRNASVQEDTRAEAIAVTGDCPPMGMACRAHRLLAWIKRRMRYVPDPRGSEAIILPRYHLAAIRRAGVTHGDCDDAATLVGSLAVSVGLVVRLVAASFLPDQLLSHVWAEAYDGGGWVELDPFRGERFDAQPTRVVIVEV